MKHFSVLLFAALIFVACGPKAPEGISIDPEVIKSTGWGGEYKVQVTCGGNWQASSNKKWVTLNPSEGKGNAEVTVTVAQEEDGEDSRATVTFSSGENTAELMIRRAALERGLFGVSPLEIEAPAKGGEYTLTVTAYETSWVATTESGWITISQASGESAGEISIIVAKNRNTEERTAIVVVSETGEEANEEHTYEVTVTQAAGEKPVEALFSVSADKKVYFSPGNFQYQPSTKTCRFAPSQFDYIGQDNLKFSSTYEGWIDLFGWGTGDNPINGTMNNSNYQTFNDWGMNKILNGDDFDPANTWRTLTNDEWTYLFSGRENSSRLCGRTTVNGVMGLIILPDNWVNPEGFELRKDLLYDKQVFSLEMWDELEYLGAVFLPPVGTRRSSGGKWVVEYDGEQSDYWTATGYDDRCAYHMVVTKSFVNTSYINVDRYYGYGVRLVKDFK